MGRSEIQWSRAEASFSDLLIFAFVVLYTILSRSISSGANA